MTNCSKNCMWYTPDCERFDCCECDCNPERVAYEQGYEDGAIAELEKIKAEIIKEKCDKCEVNYNIQKCYDDNTIGWCAVFDSLTIIDNRIKELKGE